MVEREGREGVQEIKQVLGQLMLIIKYKLLKKRAKSRLVSCLKKRMYGNDRTLIAYATSVLNDLFLCAERVAYSDIEGDEEMILKAFSECVMRRMEEYSILNFYLFAISDCLDKVIDKVIEDIEKV